MNTRININPDLTLPCQSCSTDTMKLEKFGWKPGLIFAPEWHQWFAQLQLAQESGDARPVPPNTHYYIECVECGGKGEKIATADEFAAYHLNSYQLELFKTHNIKFVKDNAS